MNCLRDLNVVCINIYLVNLNLVHSFDYTSLSFIMILLKSLVCLRLRWDSMRLFHIVNKFFMLFCGIMIVYLRLVR